MTVPARDRREATYRSHMPSRLLVILGADASWDCAVGEAPDIRPDLRPPLVSELFSNRSAFARILHQYPLAEQAAPSLRVATESGAVALEAYLRDHLRDSQHAFRRRQYWAIPPYLQHLLFAISTWRYETVEQGELGHEPSGYVAHPDNYDRLINAVLEVDEVTLVSLNYDTLLDQRLDPHGPLTTLDAYLAPAQNWALIKPHGSIDWGRRVLIEPEKTAARHDPFLAGWFAALGDAPELDNEITLRRLPTIGACRGIESGDWNTPRIGASVYYPALSAPLGAEDELACPPKHIDYVKNVTGHWDPLDVLVIGYSGLDRGVLDLLSWGGRSIRSLMVVRGSDSHAKETADRIRACVRVQDTVLGELPALFGRGFSRFVSEGVLDGYMREVLACALERDAAEPPHNRV